MATPVTPNSFTDAYQAAMCTSAHNVIITSRGGSACGFGCADDAEEMDAPRARLTRDQVLLLEKQFMETPKPTTAIRYSVAQKTGLTFQRVGNWFQNRRVKAKVQKKQEELQVMQVLESAGRRRITEPSSPAEPQDLAPQKASKPSGRRRAKSDSATARLNTTVTVQKVEMPSFSPYSSPTEASYASLARSLAQAAEAVRLANLAGMNDYTHGIPQTVLGGVPLHPEYNLSVQNIETPWQQPTSAFSDWGSSRNSIAAYTPTPAGQLEDPFEFDNPANTQSAQSPFDPNAPVQDDFNMFAAAIEMNQYNRPFVMPTFSTSGLMKRRQLSPLCAEPQNSSSTPPVPLPVLDRQDCAPPEFVHSYGSFTTSSTGSDQVAQYSEVQSSLAARRKQACPTLLSSGLPPSRSRSFNGALPVMEEEMSVEVKVMRRSRTHEDDFDKRAKKCSEFNGQQSPFNLNIFGGSIFNASTSPKPMALSSPGDLEPPKFDEEASPNLKQEDVIPDLDFSATSITPESATFDNHIPSVALLPGSYQMHLPEHQLYKHIGFPNFYDFPSEGSSASSGILLSKETNSFPFEEFLSARLNTKVKPLDGIVDHQQPLVYSQFGC